MGQARSLKQVSLGDQLAEQLRDRIVSGNIGADARLVEDLVAEEYGVSRGPVRDAISILRRENLVVDVGRQGVAVRAFEAIDVDRLFDLRFALENLAIVTASKRAPTLGSEAWLPCEQPLERMAKLAESNIPAGFAQADVDFHTGFYEVAGSAPLRAAWDLSRPLFGALQKVTLSYDEAYGESAADHRRLLDVAQRGDEAQIASELDTHLAGARRRMIAQLANG